VKRGLSFLVGGVVTLMALSVFAQNSVFDLPPSKNALVNYSIDFLKENPDKDSLGDFNQAFALQIRKIKNKSALFSSVNKALLQASEETLEGAQVYFQTESYGNYVRSSQGSDNFRVVTAIQDARLRNMAISFPLSSGVIGTALTQLHALSDSEFAKFSADFIETLKITQNQMQQINAVNLESFVRDEVKNNSSILEEASAEQSPRFLERIKISARNRFSESFAANVSVGSQLLKEQVAIPIARENSGTLDATGLKKQRVRVLTLMIQAIKEADAFNQTQRDEIANSVKLYTSQDLDVISEKAFKQAMKEAYLSEEVQSLTLQLKSLGR
jgi:hypothetical protein